MTPTALHKILYVEDEIDIQAIAKLALENIGGFEVKICSSGQEALEKVECFSPDLIILDVMMPGMDGPKTMEELRKIEAISTTPVIFMTAKVQQTEVESYKSLGALNVISKPFDPMTLASTIKSIWDTHHECT